MTSQHVNVCTSRTPTPSTDSPLSPTPINTVISVALPVLPPALQPSTSSPSLLSTLSPSPSLLSTLSPSPSLDLSSPLVPVMSTESISAQENTAPQGLLQSSPETILKDTENQEKQQQLEYEKSKWEEERRNLKVETNILKTLLVQKNGLSLRDIEKEMLSFYPDLSSVKKSDTTEELSAMVAPFTKTVTFGESAESTEKPRRSSYGHKRSQSAFNRERERINIKMNIKSKHSHEKENSSVVVASPVASPLAVFSMPFLNSVSPPTEGDAKAKEPEPSTETSVASKLPTQTTEKPTVKSPNTLTSPLSPDFVEKEKETEREPEMHLRAAALAAEVGCSVSRLFSFIFVSLCLSLFRKFPVLLFLSSLLHIGTSPLSLSLSPVSISTRV